MLRRALGFLLLAIASLMAIGSLLADHDQPPHVLIIAFGLTVLLPAAFGVALLRPRPALRGRRERLRRETLEAEALRLAAASGGKLLAVELAGATALPVEEAEILLGDLHRRGVADLQLTEDGVIVYTFHDLAHAGGKDAARGVLEA